MQGILRAGLAGLIALCIFGPLSGVILEGFSFRTEWQRPILLTLTVVLGMLVGPLLSRIPRPSFPIGGRALSVTKYLPWIALPVFLAFPWVMGKYWLSTMILALIYVLLGLGLNVVVGMAGLLDLGFVGFYAVGAYGYALGAQYLGMNFWTVLPAVALLAACFGVILAFPVLRMHGDYLAIVTLGFGEIIRLVLNNWLEFTGGPNGVSAPFPTFFGLEFSRIAKQGGIPFHEYFGLEYSTQYKYGFIYLILLIVVSLVIFAIHRFKTMPMGRAWEALREDEIACRSLGINHVVVKLSAFAFGAMIAGIAGAFFAAYQGFVNPSSFVFFESALILAIVVLGGMGSIVGVVSAALVLTLLPEVLRDFAEYRILIFGVAMVIMMIWKPSGLIKSKRPAYGSAGGRAHD